MTPNSGRARLRADYSRQMSESDHALEATRDLAGRLNQMLRFRRIAAGKAILDEAAPVLAHLSPEVPQATRLLLLIAQWVDVGYRDHRCLDTLLERFPTDCRRRLSIDDYLRLRMVEAFRALAIEDVDAAIE